MPGILIIVFLLASLPIFVFAESLQDNPGALKVERIMEQVRMDKEEYQERQLQELKKNNPKLYKERLGTIENQGEINKIVASYRNGKISGARAEKELYPLVEKSLGDYIDSLDEKIVKFEKKLESLKNIKRDPDIMIKNRIDQLLGKTVSSPEDLLI